MNVCWNVLWISYIRWEHFCLGQYAFSFIIACHVKFRSTVGHEAADQKWPSPLVIWFMAPYEGGLVCQNRVTRTETSNYIPQYLWDVITCPCPWYLLLLHDSSYIFQGLFFSDCWVRFQLTQEDVTCVTSLVFGLDLGQVNVEQGGQVKAWCCQIIGRYLNKYWVSRRYMVSPGDNFSIERSHGNLVVDYRWHFETHFLNENVSI